MTLPYGYTIMVMHCSAILPDKGIRSLKICHGIKLWVEQNYQQNVEQQNGLSEPCKL